MIKKFKQLHNNYIYGFHGVSAYLKKILHINENILHLDTHNTQTIEAVYDENNDANNLNDINHNSYMTLINNVKSIYLDEKRNDSRVRELLLLIDDCKLNKKIHKVPNTQLDKMLSCNKHQGVIIELNTYIMPNNIKTSSILGRQTVGVLSLDNIIEKNLNKERSIILILDGVTDPHNLGAIIRTADCFGVDAILLPKNNSANVNNPFVMKTSSGALNNIDIINVSNLSTAISILKKHEYWVCGTSLSEDSINLYDFQGIKKLVLVMGSEGAGMSRLVAENCDYLLNIPMLGHTASLNVSVATGVVLSYMQYIAKI